MTRPIHAVMKKKPPAPAETASLRRRAEDEIRERKGARGSAAGDLPGAADAQRVLHELQVHQVELEMQNTELRHTRDQLEASLAKYTELYDFAPVGYFTVDADGRIHRVNLSGARQVGAERSRVTGTSFARFLPLHARPGFQTFLQKVFAGNEMLDAVFEMGVPAPGAQFVKIRAQCAPDRTSCSLVVVDVTGQKKAEDNLRISEIRYRRLFEAAQDGVLLLDPGTRKITHANPFLTKLLDLPQDQLVGRELFEIGLLKHEVQTREMFRKLKCQPQVHYPHLSFENLNGRHQDLEVVASLYQENGTGVIQCHIRDITERKLAEDILRESEWLLRHATASARLTFLEVDFTSGTVRPAPNFSEVMGYTPACGDAPEVSARVIRLLLDPVIPEDRVRVSLALNHFLGKRAIEKLAYRVRGDDGQERWIESRWNYERDPAGRTLKIFATCLDITERMQAAAALRLSEERYHTLFESMDEGFCIIDLIFDKQNHPIDWWFLEANPSFEHHAGIPRSAGKRALEVIPGLEKDWFGIFGRIAQTGEPLRFMKQSPALDNRWFELYAFRIGGPESRKVAVVFSNISARVNTELELREKARLLDLTHDAIIVRDMEGHIRYWNHGAEELYGWSRAEALGKVSHQLLRTEFPSPMEEMVEELNRTAHWSGELIDRKRNGRKVTVLARKTLDRDSSGNPSVVLENLTDITIRKEAETAQHKLEVLTATNRKLEQEIFRRQAVEKSLKLIEQEQGRLLKQSQRQQQLLRNMSHQILNAQEEERKKISRELHDVIAQTLVGINVHVAALGKSGTGLPADFQQKIDRTRLVVEQAVGIVHQFARELRPTMLDDLGLIPALHGCLNTFMTETGVRPSLRVFAGVEQCSDTLRTVLYRVAQEALTNVARHAEASQVEVTIKNSGGGVSMEIKDDGKGFAPEGTPGAKRSHRLGLLGMRERVEMLGGTLRLISAPGQPTTVQADFPAPSLPLKKPAAKQSSKKRPPKPA